MLPIVNGMVWMEDRGDEETPSWAAQNNNNGCIVDKKDELGSLSTFKSMLGVEDEDWYVNTNNDNTILTFPSNFTESDNNLLLQSVGSSSSCSPSSASVFTNLDPSQEQYFLPSKPSISSVLNPISNNPLDHSFDLGCETGFLQTHSLTSLNRGGGILTGFTDLTSQSLMGTHNLALDPQFSNTHSLQLTGSTSFRGFQEEGFGNPLFLNRSKMLKPLQNFTSIGAQPTLFQKRAALRKNLANNGTNLGVLGTERGGISSNVQGYSGKMEVSEANEKKKRKYSIGEDVEDVSLDGSGLNYDSDEFMENNKVEESGKNGGNSSNANSTVTGGDQKGKKRGLPAKNLMAERRRRKKLNDRLYMLRSVVPKISKMDRASILRDAIEYLKELLQKIKDLHNELESNPPGSSLTPTSTSFYPLTPTPHSLPCRIKEELCPSSLPSPNGLPARVEVRLSEGRAVNIHMFCSRRPGLLLSTMRALENLGLDIQQAVISCFNGFAMDIFRAEQCRESPKLIDKYVILWAGIIQERIDCSQSIPMNFVINHALHRITENRINIIDEHTEICGLWVITTQVWMASFHAIIVGFLNLLWCGIWKQTQQSIVIIGNGLRSRRVPCRNPDSAKPFSPSSMGDHSPTDTVVGKQGPSTSWTETL